MGQSASSCFKGPAECTVDVSCEQTLQTHLNYHSKPISAKPASKQTCEQQDTSGACADQAQAADSPSRDAAFCCLLGTASEPGAPYDVTSSGPPLPGCEADRLGESHLGELLEYAPRDELQSILGLVCSMFHVNNALVSLFFDRRVYIIDGTGAFTEGDFPWRYSMCGWTMASERHCVMIVNDVAQDARFCQSPVAKKYGVRFYVGAPLVSSSGHRLGTLCFADSQPRVFDDTSMKLLCNFSELVTRALERDIVIAHQQEMSRPRAALQELEHKHQYRMLLRSVDCVNSAVLLVDTGTTGWVIRYVNSGWHDLVLQQKQSQATQDWVAAAGDARGSNPEHNSSSSVPSSSNNAQPAVQGSTPTGGGAAAADGMQLASGVEVPDLSGSAVVGGMFFPALERQLAREADGGADMLRQLRELLSNRQPFSLHGAELEGLGGATATLVFRSAGGSDIEGAISICVPSWVPDSTDAPAAAAALQANLPDKVPAKPTSAPWQTLYFVTVTLESAEDRRNRNRPPGMRA